MCHTRPYNWMMSTNINFAEKVIQSLPQEPRSLMVNLLRTQNNLSKLLNSLMILQNLHELVVVEWVLDRHMEPIVTCKKTYCRPMLTLKR